MKAEGHRPGSHPLALNSANILSCQSYSCHVIGRMSIKALDPTLCLGFFFPTVAEFDAFSSEKPLVGVICLSEC